MKNAGKVATLLVVAVVSCFAVASVVQAGGKLKTAPIWQITKHGTDKSVNWKKHKPNPRFKIYNAGTPEDQTDDVVLDQETGLVWARDAHKTGVDAMAWQDAIDFCRQRTLAWRDGWRLPTIEELSSLMDTGALPISLPNGHPFINAENDFYWSSTTYESDSTKAWCLFLGGSGFPTWDHKDEASNYVWPVRGGNGYATGNW